MPNADEMFYTMLAMNDPATMLITNKMMANIPISGAEETYLLASVCNMAGMNLNPAKFMAGDAFLRRSCLPGKPMCDLNGDGYVGFADLVGFMRV